MKTDVSTLTVTEGKDQFYPTPNAVAGKMLAGIDWAQIETILEPSAGKGNLIECAAKANRNNSRGYSRSSLDVDCIEIDPYLRQILQYNFSEGRVREIRSQYKAIDAKSYSNRTEAEKTFMCKTREEADVIDNVDLHIVHDDFLTYRGEKRYDLILMNPPFSDGDLHLLKAIEVQKNGGAIVCLLNAETILNPCTNTRQLLKQQIEKYEAKVSFIENGFSDAERRTDVNVAIVKINIPKVIHKSTIYERMEKAAEKEHQFADREVYDLVAGDYLEQAVQHYNVEVAATLELIKEYEALKPYMVRELGTKDHFGQEPILTLVVERDSSYCGLNVNRYMRVVRLKYWRALFKNKKFIGKLTSNLRLQYLETVDKMADYDFTLFNINQVLIDMNSNLVDGVKATILDLFDKLTSEHSWYPECAKNRHYFNGWATNKAHKIGKKSIIPTNGMFSSYSWSRETFNVSAAYKVISDIEKVFNYLDGGMTQEVDLDACLKTAEMEGRTRNIECKYFKVDLFKKGTMHIKFTNMDLVEKLNIYAAKNKKWLPPNYGRTTYSDMTSEEKTVIDSFQGEKAYSRVVSMAAYFLAEPTKNIAMIGAGNETIL